MSAAEQPQGIEQIFQVSQTILEEQPWLAEVYDDMIARLRKESFGIPMHTMQSMLIERIAATYVMIRYREVTGWLGASAEKDTNARWMDMVKEWNRLLAAGHEQLRTQLLEQVQEITLKGVEMIADKDTRQNVRRLYQEEFARLGQ